MPLKNLLRNSKKIGSEEHLRNLEEGDQSKSPDLLAAMNADFFIVF